ncbi:unnamed protein product [Brassicogethes aeneus]|uniref:C2H2-type domain-containing protein n=1 Tax=Brassicogethes aeneus TaxID=1431903 RepID=A0A9P0FG99_BRAAE|nr:unnamed protein product [Brassicogethes aeneus]
MVGGYLQYQHYQEDLPPSPQYSYFQHFDPYYKSSMDISEELMFPPSPISTQSDSDNSISSVEISSKQIQNQDKSDVQCRWKNCGISFLTLDQLATHVTKVHAVGGPGGLFYCGWEGCGRNNRGFNARYKMLVHVRTHTNEKPHKCPQCEKSFSRAENLKIHSRSHSGEKPYVCTVPGCNKAYSNSSDRFKHSRTHQVDKPYYCKVPGCSKRYTDPSSLRKHVKTYKHFVNENVNNEKTQELPVKEVQTNKDRLQSSPVETEENILRPQLCNCNRSCCISSCLNSTNDYLSLGTIINLRKEDKSITWNRFFNPFISEPKSIYKPYVDGTAEVMEVDVPLDLSVHRKQI